MFTTVSLKCNGSVALSSTLGGFAAMEHSNWFAHRLAMGTHVCLRIGVQVLYNLFEWPMRKGSRLAVIGVANTMDLPQRLLPRIASRLGSRSPALPTCSCPSHMLLPYALALPTCSCPAHTLVLVLLTLSILCDTLRHTQTCNECPSPPARVGLAWSGLCEIGD